MQNPALQTAKGALGAVKCPIGAQQQRVSDLNKDSALENFQ